MACGSSSGRSVDVGVAICLHTVHQAVEACQKAMEEVQGTRERGVSVTPMIDAAH